MKKVTLILLLVVIATGANSPRLDRIVRRGDYAMGLARPLNTLIICAAFAFVGALIMGILA